jgi:tetratricopeptide (TPR) repeat protein
MRFFDILLGKIKTKEKDLLQQTLSLSRKKPDDARVHRRLAEIYQKKGEKEKAISAYLQAAEIFARDNLYAEAMAIYKQISRQAPSLDDVYLKIADIYRQMGFLGDAFAQYRILVSHYDQLGMKDKALAIMSLMAELDPRQITLEEKVASFREIVQGGEAAEEAAGAGDIISGGVSGSKKKQVPFDFKAQLEMAEREEEVDVKEVSTQGKVCGFDDLLKELQETAGPSAVYPIFNYQMGVASREMGFLEDAVEQFKTAAAKGQNRFEAQRMLGICYKELGRLDEASRVLELALQAEEIPAEKKLQAQYELGQIYKEQGRTEEALGLLREISAAGQRIREGKPGMDTGSNALGPGENRRGNKNGRAV